ncbi:MAG: FIST N-terminal domain-containing protein [Chloroflexota bacterium]
MLKIGTSWSTAHNSETAIAEASQALINKLDQHPDLVIAYVTDPHEPNTVQAALRTAFPDAQIQGGTSCIGTMTQNGFHSHDGYSIGLFGIVDKLGDYGVGVAQIFENPRQAGAEAIDHAIAAAGRYGEPPELIWINGVPGAEEQVILGIQDIVGTQIPIAGGSSADNSVSGKWFQFTHDRFMSNGVTVTAMYPSVETYVAFHSGYSTTEFSGVVTKASGRSLEEINGRPAAEVYNEWTNGLLNGYLNGGNILAQTTLNPLARYVDQIGSIDYHRLSHPQTATANGALTLFTNIEEGEELILMAGTRDSLINRAGRVAQSALDLGRISANDVSGALVIYCAGCMLTVQDGMNDVAKGIANTLNGTPFIGTFTFGEQGCFINGDNYHGNLMISIVVFGK